jgi:MATE family multidrug resistance protein
MTLIEQPDKQNINEFEAVIDFSASGHDSGAKGDELFGLTEDSSQLELLSVFCQQAIPLGISFFLSIGGVFINLAFAGHYSDENGNKSAVFAAMSLSNLFATVSCRSVLIGMSSAVETLGSQNNGAGNYKQVGILLQRSLLVLSVLSIPLLFLWIFVGDIFRLIGVEETVCGLIERFLFIRAFAVPLDIVMFSYEKYLMAIGVMSPCTWGNLSFICSIFVLNVTFVFGLGLHYECLMWSFCLALLLSCVVQIALSLRYPEVQRTLQPFSAEAWQDWKEFVLLGLPATVMLCSEWWAYEILTIFASLLGTVEVSAQSIIIQTASFAFMIPLGMGITVASLVGNAVGAKKIPLARRIGRLGLKVALAAQMAIGLVILLAGRFFVLLFTTDAAVIRSCDRAMALLSVFTIVDGLQCVSSGILRGCGKQFIGAVANIFAFYAIGLPAAWIVCFRLNFGVNGLMAGMAFGAVFQLAALLSVIFCFERYLFTAAIRTDGFQQLQTSEDDDGAVVELREMVAVSSEV